jgi:16S rRNA (guanine966-N2)-methyltransferase
MPNNQVRIIAGHWRGRKITFDDSEGLRPTSNRIRETLFNWLTPYIEHSKCLDLFAGSGALGLEALSRGAKEVCFIDNNRNTIKKLQATLEQLSAQHSPVYLANALQFIQEKDISNFDIFFVDPPYSTLSLSDIAETLEQALGQKSCRIYYESYQAIEQQQLLPNWYIEKQKKAGKVNFYLIHRQPA